MKFDILECIVLRRDLPEHGLRKDDLGTIVEVYPPHGLEVEFVAASGETQAVVSLSTADVRKVSESDILAVRSLTA